MIETELVRRAFKAYCRRATATGGKPMQPSRDSGVQELGGKQYVLLFNVIGLLAVYRVLNSGALKLLKRPPADIGVAVENGI